MVDISRIARRWGGALGLTLLGLARTASAADAADAGDKLVTVVDVKPGASSLDAAQLRTQIARELGGEVVVPGDARASGALGTLTIDLDAKTGKLSVGYVARSVPVIRHLTPSGGVEATRAAAVALAGNLARNEAAALADELRPKPAPVPAAPLPAPLPPSAVLAPPSADERRAAADARDERLRAVLDYHAQAARSSRHVLGASLLAGDVVAVTTLGYLASKSERPSVAWGFAGVVGLPLTSLALTSLVVESPYEDLADYAHQPGAAPMVLGTWQNMANSERRARRTGGVLELVASALSLGAATYTLLDDPRNDTNIALGATLAATGIGYGVLGAHLLGTEGPVEAGLKAYRASTGQLPAAPARISARFTVAPTPGGALGVLSGSF